MKIINLYKTLNFKMKTINQYKIIIKMNRTFNI